MTVHSTAPAVAKRTLARTQALALALIAVATAFHEAAAALLILISGVVLARRRGALGRRERAALGMALCALGAWALLKLLQQALAWSPDLSLRLTLMLSCCAFGAALLPLLHWRQSRRDRARPDSSARALAWQARLAAQWQDQDWDVPQPIPELSLPDVAGRATLSFEERELLERLQHLRLQMQTLQPMATQRHAAALSVATWLDLLAEVCAAPEDAVAAPMAMGADELAALTRNLDQDHSVSAMRDWPDPMRKTLDQIRWLVHRIACQSERALAAREALLAKGWRSNGLISSLSSAQLDALAPLLIRQTLSPGALLHPLHAPPDGLWLLGEGQVVLERPVALQDTAPTEWVEMGRLGSKQFTGVESLLRQEASAWRARCSSAVLAWYLPSTGLATYKLQTGQDLLTQSLASQTLALSEQVDQAQLRTLAALHQALQASQHRSAFGTLLTHLILLIFVYTSALGALQHWANAAGASTWISSGALFLMALVAGWTVRQTGLPLPVFGLRLQGWQADVRDALRWSVLVCALCTVLKLACISFVPAFAELRLFSPWVSAAGLWATVGAYALYALFSPVQEFVARGVIQGCLQHMLSGRGAAMRAILVSNAVFSISHQHLGLGYALLVFVPGLFWGWLYLRHQTLVGVSVSHLLIGLWVTGVLDLAAFVQAA